MTTRTMTTTRTTTRTRALLFGAALALTACTGSDMTNTDEQDLTDTLGTLGGQTVDDTTIVHEPGSPTVSIGGLPVALPRAAQLVALDGPNINTSPTWPLLDDLQLFNPETPESSPEYGLVTFAQTDLVTNDDDRRTLIDDFYAATGQEDFDGTHTSTITDPDTDITCWTEIRAGERAPGFDSASGITLFVGPGIAASAVTTFVGGDPDLVPGFVGDVVEAICNTRPDGL